MVVLYGISVGIGQLLQDVMLLCLYKSLYCDLTVWSENGSKGDMDP